MQQLKIDPLLVPQGLATDILMSQKEVDAMINELEKQLEEEFHGTTIHTAVNLQGGLHFYSRIIEKMYDCNMRRLQRIISAEREKGTPDQLIRPLVEAARLIMIEDSIGTSKYGHGTDKAGQVYLTKDLNEVVENQIFILFEDVLDSGGTLTYLWDHFIRKGVARLVFVCLFQKDVTNSLPPDTTVYIGDQVPDVWLVGALGLDSIGKDHNGLTRGGMYRYLPYLTTPL